VWQKEYCRGYCNLAVAVVPFEIRGSQQAISDNDATHSRLFDELPEVDGTAAGTYGYYPPGDVSQWGGTFDGSRTYVTAPIAKSMPFNGERTESRF
jgi:hypothetical protein